MKQEVQPSHGDTGVCRHCGGAIQYIESQQWKGLELDTLGTWWSHDKYPEDGHDAEPKEAE